MTTSPGPAVPPLDDAAADALDIGVRRLVMFLRTRGYHTTDSGDGETKPAALAALVESGTLRPSYQCASCSTYVNMATLRCGCDDGRLWCRRCGKPSKVSPVRPAAWRCSCAEPDHRLGDDGFLSVPHVHIRSTALRLVQDAAALRHDLAVVGLPVQPAQIQATYDPVDESAVLSLYGVTDEQLPAGAELAHHEAVSFETTAALRQRIAWLRCALPDADNVGAKAVLGGNLAAAEAELARRGAADRVTAAAIGLHPATVESDDMPGGLSAGAAPIARTSEWHREPVSTALQVEPSPEDMARAALSLAPADQVRMPFGAAVIAIRAERVRNAALVPTRGDLLTAVHNAAEALSKLAHSSGSMSHEDLDLLAAARSALASLPSSLDGHHREATEEIRYAVETLRRFSAEERAIGIDVAITALRTVLPVLEVLVKEGLADILALIAGNHGGDPAMDQMSRAGNPSP